MGLLSLLDPTAAYGFLCKILGVVSIFTVGGYFLKGVYLANDPDNPIPPAELVQMASFWAPDAKFFLFGFASIILMMLLGLLLQCVFWSFESCCLFVLCLPCRWLRANPSRRFLDDPEGYYAGAHAHSHSHAPPVPQRFTQAHANRRPQTTFGTLPGILPSSSLVKTEKIT